MAKFLNFKKNSKDPSAETQPANSTAVANEVVSEPENVSQNIDSVVEEKYFGKSLGYLSDEKRRLAERSEALKRRLGEIKLSYNDLIRERERVSEEQQQALSDFNEASLESFKNELFAENNEENPVNPADAEGVAGELISQKKERLQSMKQVENEKDERCSALDQALFDKAEEMDSIQKEIDEIFHTNQAIEAAIADAGSDEQEPVQEEEPQGKNTVARLRRKVASQVRGIHFLNLSSLLKADCEVDYGITKLIVNYAIAFVVIALIGLVYALELPYVLILCLVYFLFGPSLVYFHHRKKYEKKKFATCVRYIEQMIFSFTRNTKLLNALEETNVLMTGKIHDAIESAIVKIRHGKNNNSLYSEALKEIEEFFPCVRVKNLHELLIGVERDGGRYTSSLDIMLEDVREWDIRSNNFQQEQTVKGISMVISILMSLGVCFFMTNILPDDMGGDISGFGLYQFITTLSLVVMFFIYRLSARKLTSSWVNDDLGEDEGRIQSDYKAVKKYNENPQGKIKPIFAITRMQTAMEKAFPRWVMRFALLASTKPIPVALAESSETAPVVMKDELAKLNDNLENDPNTIYPYIEFFKDFDMPQVRSMMMMVFSLNAADHDDVEKHILSIVKRNHLLQATAEKIEYDEKMAMFTLFSTVPMLLACVIMMIDVGMILFNMLNTVM